MNGALPSIFPTISLWLVLLSPFLYFFSKRLKDSNLSAAGQLLSIFFAGGPGILIMSASVSGFFWVALPLNNITWYSQLTFLVMSLGVLFAVSVGVFEVKRIKLSSLRFISHVLLLFWFVMYLGTAVVQIHTMVFLHSNNFDKKTAGVTLAPMLNKPCSTGYFYMKVNRQAKIETYCPNSIYSSAYTYADIPQVIYLLLEKDQVINYQKVNPLWSLTDWRNAKDNQQAIMDKIISHGPKSSEELG